MGAVGGGRRSAVVPTADVAHAPTVPAQAHGHIGFLEVTVTTPCCRSEIPVPALQDPAQPRNGRRGLRTHKRGTAACWGGCRPLFQRGYRLARGGGKPARTE